jgi:hypothetical protein
MVFTRREEKFLASRFCLGLTVQIMRLLNMPSVTGYEGSNAMDISLLCEHKSAVEAAVYTTPNADYFSTSLPRE